MHAFSGSSWWMVIVVFQSLFVIGVHPYLVWISICPRLYHDMINDNGRKHIVPLVAMDTAKEIKEDFLKFDFYLILFCIVFIVLVVDFPNIIRKMHLHLF